MEEKSLEDIIKFWSTEGYRDSSLTEEILEKEQEVILEKEDEIILESQEENVIMFSPEEEVQVFEEVQTPLENPSLDEINSNLSLAVDLLYILVWFCFLLVSYNVVKFVYRRILMKWVSSMLKLRL